MLIDLQTKSRWRITISSPHHTVAYQPARPGACPFVSGPGDHSCFFSTPSLQPYTKDSCPLRNGEQIQGRRNTFWNFSKLLKGIRQMYSSRHFPMAPDEPHPHDARPYETSYMGGCLDGTITELPAMPLPELAGTEIDQHKGSSMPYNTGGMQGGYQHDEYLMSPDHAVPHTLGQTDMLRFPLGLSSHQPSDPAPSLVSGHPSHVSSPVSSLDTNSLHGLPFASHGDFGKEYESSINTYSPSQPSWTGINGIGVEKNGAWQNDPVSLAMMYRTQASFASAEGSHSSHLGFRHDSRVEHTSWQHSDGVPMDDAGSTASFPRQDHTASALPQSRGSGSIPPGVYEQQSNNMWIHRPLDGLERRNAKIANRPTIGVSPSQIPSQAGQSDGQQQSKNYVEHHDHTYPEVVEEAECECKCSECGQVFSGKWCNTNLRRHVRGHKGTAERQCSVCRQKFNRSDAVRKHEWEKHRLSSAKPKKRANS